MKELCQYIEVIDLLKEREKSEKLLNMMGSYETGRAAQICCAWIADKCGVNENEKHVFEEYLTKCTGEPDITRINMMKKTEKKGE